ncbi:MAG TPA: hypothetical protein VKA14_02600 [Gammaproteobacteria bacterium]|nr:hypothetical protein [Gammaproteobacteria bacterium]
MEANEPAREDRQLLIAVFRDQQPAARAVERLIERDFPADQLSLLGKHESSGDDVLGIYYQGVGERMKAWAGHGAFWGGLWGLLASAAGMFVVPGLGAVMAVGPIVEALVGGATGAAVAGSAMAGAAALSQVAVALHRMGVPEERLHHYHEAIDQGHYVVLLRCGSREETDRRRTELGTWGADEVEVFAYR